MLPQNQSGNQLPNEILAIFNRIKLSALLRKSGIVKRNGSSPTTTFIALFQLIFDQETFSAALNGTRKDHYPHQDVIYRFMGNFHYNWRKFLTNLSYVLYTWIAPLTSVHRAKVFVIDDSLYKRDRSKKVELLARIYDHTTHRLFFDECSKC